MLAKAVGTPVMDFFFAALGLVVSAALGYTLFPLTTPTAGFIVDVSWTLFSAFDRTAEAIFNAIFRLFGKEPPV